MAQGSYWSNSRFQLVCQRVSMGAHLWPSQRRRCRGTRYRWGTSSRGWPGARGSCSTECLCMCALIGRRCLQRHLSACWFRSQSSLPSQRLTQQECCRTWGLYESSVSLHAGRRVPSRPKSVRYTKSAWVSTQQHGQAKPNNLHETRILRWQPQV